MLSDGTGSSVNLKRSAINNSLLDLTDNHSVLAYPGYPGQDRPTRRGSVGSLGRCHQYTHVVTR